jgi:hypothetical protein
MNFGLYFYKYFGSLCVLCDSSEAGERKRTLFLAEPAGFAEKTQKGITWDILASYFEEIVLSLWPLRALAKRARENGCFLSLFVLQCKT